MILLLNIRIKDGIDMTRWDVLKDVLLSRDLRKSIGKAWPLFFYLAFNVKDSNKFITSYPELKDKLKESQHNNKKWRDHLVEQNVVNVINGRLSMTLSFISPYDSLVTCMADDMTQIKLKSDPKTKQLMDKLSSYNNMSLLPLVAELSSKLEVLEKKLD